ncbi:5-oxoprolinase subunit PxpB [Neobacillus sp. PS3-40]|uniref:5-oxoprolinase subunit PxpB n=1 Tax=Neobacillus sp. PS3-40 TaxID=3070679 RepID=UPI0027E13C0A|nr:5-oxoprolinase subunit PxpB [Neobacillus sp. PS3-40]WML43955.1 5-oxoprolinase subunit PxpB [Neobacillus sp. PS3-40]
MQMYPLGDSAIIVQFDNKITLDAHYKVRVLVDRLQGNSFKGMLEFVPALTTVTVYYNPLQLSYKEAYSALERIVSSLEATPMGAARTVEIPVCYGGEFGPDLEFVADHNGLTVDEVVQIHSGSEYLVYMIGFAPGFPYLGGMSENIQAPRRSSPRITIPAGTVGIAGMQTGIYPIETPGGWQLIGRTPEALFRPNESSPSLLQIGDIVRFRPILGKEYGVWKGRVK